MSEYRNIRLQEIKAWATFTKERFEPISHFIMISLFVWAHYLLASNLSNTHISISRAFVVYIGCALFFFKLRLYDEIKDYQLDCVKNPKRPLPRGVLSVMQVKRAIELVLIIELLLFSHFNTQAFLTMLIPISYSLIMYNEFFCAKLIRPHLTFYATIHTFVTLFLSIGLFSGLTNLPFWQLDRSYYFFAIISWLVFNIFELGRKTYQPSEEREGVESYSKIWGKTGAFALVFVHALIANYLSIQLVPFSGQLMKIVLLIQVIILFLVGLFYIFTKSQKIGALYRGYSSVYIILVYTTFIIKLAQDIG